MRASRLLAVLLPAATLLGILAGTRSSSDAPGVRAPAIEVPTSRSVAVADVPVAARRPEVPEKPVQVALPRTRALAPPSWGPGEEERHFKWLRETSDERALERELDELSELLHRQCAAEIRARVAAGEVERIAANEEGHYPVPLPRRGVVEFVSGGPGVGLVRVHIPETSVPAAYETQRRIDWLRDLLP